MKNTNMPDRVYLCWIEKEDTKMLVGAFYSKVAAEKYMNGTGQIQEVMVNPKDYKN